MHLSDAVLESVMVFRLGAGAVAEVVVPLCLAKGYIYDKNTVRSCGTFLLLPPSYIRRLGAC
jgi:hypothetical protein